jgi:hypothetical protein
MKMGNFILDPPVKPEDDKTNKWPEDDKTNGRRMTKMAAR